MISYVEIQNTIDIIWQKSTPFHANFQKNEQYFFSNSAEFIVKNELFAQHLKYVIYDEGLKVL